MSLENKPIAPKLKVIRDMISHNTPAGEIFFKKMFSQEFDRYLYGDDEGDYLPLNLTFSLSTLGPPVPAY